MSFNRYSPSRNPTYYESLAERTVDDVRDGNRPHGGNFQVLAYFAPSLAVETLDRILDELHVPEEEWPQTVEEIADIFDWEQPQHKESFIRQHSKSEKDATSGVAIESSDPLAHQKLAMFLVEHGRLATE